MGALPLAPALSACSAEVDVVVIDFKSEVDNIRPWNPVHLWRFDVDDAFAEHAYEVMVLMDLRVETSRRTGMAYFGNHAGLHQSVQNTVHSCTRYLRQPGANVIVDLVCSRMILPGTNGLEYDTPLCGQGKPQLPAHLLELLHSLLP
jgi:hypothetical protein